MKREDAHEGMNVRVIAVPNVCSYAGVAGTIIQIWPLPEFKWYDYATVAFGEEESAHILFEDIEPEVVKGEQQ